MKLLLVIFLVLIVAGCAPEKSLIQKDTGVKEDIQKERRVYNPEEQESVYVYDQIKKESLWMNKTKDAGEKCKVAAECVGWCEPVEGSKEGKCSWFPKPIGCKKRVERFEIFDVCANLTVAQP
ncbi:MAG TPA: hypothetical protein VJH37_00935 [Candidatus Nanoarchaeia archaeon]|nr:hypothetical protein [Candidatus Nanoarchaeia archaeon]